MNAIYTAYVQLAPNTVHGVPRARRFRNLRPKMCAIRMLFIMGRRQPSTVVTAAATDAFAIYIVHGHFCAAIVIM